MIYKISNKSFWINYFSALNFRKNEESGLFEDENRRWNLKWSNLFGHEWDCKCSQEACFGFYQAWRFGFWYHFSSMGRFFCCNVKFLISLEFDWFLGNFVELIWWVHSNSWNFIWVSACLINCWVSPYGLVWSWKNGGVTFSRSKIVKNQNLFYTLLMFDLRSACKSMLWVSNIIRKMSRVSIDISWNVNGLTLVRFFHISSLCLIQLS